MTSISTIKDEPYYLQNSVSMLTMFELWLLGAVVFPVEILKNTSTVKEYFQIYRELNMIYQKGFFCR